MLQACCKLLGGSFDSLFRPVSGLLPGADQPSSGGASRSARVSGIDARWAGQVTVIQSIPSRRPASGRSAPIHERGGDGRLRFMKWRCREFLENEMNVAKMTAPAYRVTNR